MTAITATWAIPYAQSTDPLCNGCTITESVAERVDAILADFDKSLSSVQVQPLARASRTGSQLNVSLGTLIYDTIDFDTTGIADLNQPTAPIQITLEGRWLMGGFVYNQTPSASTGILTIAVSSVNGAPATGFGLYGFRQRAPGANTDLFGSTSFIYYANGGLATDRIFASTSPGVIVYRSFVWAWRVGANV